MILGISTKMNFDRERETGFVTKILSGQKTTTVRGGFRWKPGDVAHLYTGSRTPDAKLHGELPVEYVADALIMFGDSDVMEGQPGKPLMLPDKNNMIVYYNGYDITEHLKVIGYRDGFDKLDDFKRWFFEETTTGEGVLVGQFVHFKAADALSLSGPYLDAEHVAVVKGIINEARALYNGGKADKKKLESLKWQQSARERIYQSRREMWAKYEPPAQTD